MLKYVLLLLLLLAVAGVSTYILMRDDYSTNQVTLEKGKMLFTRNCMSCHSLEGDGIGPPLGGITSLLSKDVLIEFIKDPSKQIKAKEERAVSLQMRYKQIMPGFEWMHESEIGSILSYINEQTKLHDLKPLSLDKDSLPTGLTGRLVAPIKKSDIKIELTEVVQIPKTKDSSPDLGIVTLRPHPAGDGTLFVNDQNGIIYLVENKKAEVFLDIRERIKDFQRGPGIATGIGSFDFDPDFLNNGMVYITYAETFKGQRPDYAATLDSLQSVVQWVVSEWKMDDVNRKIFKGTHRELLRLHAPNFGHGCQDIGFVPNLAKQHPDYGMLYIGYGDGGSNNIKHPELGHHFQSFLGTIMRIDPAGRSSKNGKYGIPPDNPFVNEADPATVKEIYALGFRNPHRFAWDVNNQHRLIATDIGEANIEELNIIEKGGDYGWPSREGTFGISTLKELKRVYALGPSDRDLYKKPYVMYDHEEGNAIGGGYVYDGDLDVLKNKYVFGDIVNGRLFYVNIDPQLTDSTIYELTIVDGGGKETTLQEMCNTKRLHQRIAYDHFKKQLYVLTKADGKVWRVDSAYK